MTEENVMPERLMLQIFYFSGSQLVIIDTAVVIARIYKAYNDLPPDYPPIKIRDWSPESTRHYCIGTTGIANMILENAPPIDDDDDDEEETEPEGDGDWTIGDLGHGS